MNRFFLAMVLALPAIACSHSQQARAPETAATAAPLAAGAAEAACPLGVQGAQVAAMDTADGAALNFTASPDKLTELRQRVRDAVAAQQASRREAQAMHGEPDSGANTGMAPSPAPPPRAQGTGSDTGSAPQPTPPASESGTGATGAVSPAMPGTEELRGTPGMIQGPPGTATVEDTADGVRVVYAPGEGADPEGARAAVRRAADRIQSTPCPARPRAP